MNVSDAAGLLTATAGSAVIVSGLVAALKAIAFPASWQTGRAPMVAVAILSALLVGAAAFSLELDLANPASWQAVAAAWLAVYGGAIATHQTVTKAGRIVTGTTNPTGPDDAS